MIEDIVLIEIKHLKFLKRFSTYGAALIHGITFFLITYYYEVRNMQNRDNWIIWAR